MMNDGIYAEGIMRANAKQNINCIVSEAELQLLASVPLPKVLRTCETAFSNVLQKAILTLLLGFGAVAGQAQTSTTVTFGQNRVQYKDFTFSYYESDNFPTYFYQGGQDIAKYVIKTAEDNAEELSKML